MRSILKAVTAVEGHHDQYFMDSTDNFKTCMSAKMYKTTGLLLNTIQKYTKNIRAKGKLRYLLSAL